MESSNKISVTVTLSNANFPELSDAEPDAAQPWGEFKRTAYVVLSWSLGAHAADTGSAIQSIPYRLITNGNPPLTRTLTGKCYEPPSSNARLLITVYAQTKSKEGRDCKRRVGYNAMELYSMKKGKTYEVPLQLALQRCPAGTIQVKVEDIHFNPPAEDTRVHDFPNALEKVTNVASRFADWLMDNLQHAVFERIATPFFSVGTQRRLNGGIYALMHPSNCNDARFFDWCFQYACYVQNIDMETCAQYAQNQINTPDMYLPKSDVVVAVIACAMNAMASANPYVSDYNAAEGNVDFEDFSNSASADRLHVGGGDCEDAAQTTQEIFKMFCKGAGLWVDPAPWPTQELGTFQRFSQMFLRCVLMTWAVNSAALSGAASTPSAGVGCHVCAALFPLAYLVIPDVNFVDGAVVPGCTKDFIVGICEGTGKLDANVNNPDGHDFLNKMQRMNEEAPYLTSEFSAGLYNKIPDPQILKFYKRAVQIYANCWDGVYDAVLWSLRKSQPEMGVLLEDVVRGPSKGRWKWGPAPPFTEEEKDATQEVLSTLWCSVSQCGGRSVPPECSTFCDSIAFTGAKPPGLPIAHGPTDSITYIVPSDKTSIAKTNFERFKNDVSLHQKLGVVGVEARYFPFTQNMGVSAVRVFFK